MLPPPNSTRGLDFRQALAWLILTYGPPSPTLQHLATDPRHGPRLATRKQKPRPASEANAPCAPRGTSCPQGLVRAQSRHTCVRFQLGRGRVVSLQTGMLLGRGRDAGAKAGPGRPRRPGRPPPRGARNRADGQLGPHAACWRFRPARHRPATDFTTRHTLGVTSPTAASPENKRMPWTGPTPYGWTGVQATALRAALATAATTQGPGTEGRGCQGPWGAACILVTLTYKALGPPGICGFKTFFWTPFSHQ